MTDLGCVVVPGSGPLWSYDGSKLGLVSLLFTPEVWKEELARQRGAPATLWNG